MFDAIGAGKAIPPPLRGIDVSIIPFLALVAGQAFAVEFDQETYDRSSEGIAVTFDAHVAAVEELEASGHVVHYLQTATKDQGVLWKLTITEMRSNGDHGVEQPVAYGMDELREMLAKQVERTVHDDEAWTSFDYVPEAPMDDPLGFFEFDLVVVEKWELSATPAVGATGPSAVTVAAVALVVMEINNCRDGDCDTVDIFNWVVDSTTTDVEVYEEVWPSHDPTLTQDPGTEDDPDDGDDEPDGGMCGAEQTCENGEDQGEPAEDEPAEDEPAEEPDEDPDYCDTHSDERCEEDSAEDGYQDPENAGVVGCEGAECDLGGLGSIIDPADYDPLQTLIYTLDATGEVPLSVLKLAGSPHLTEGPSDVDFMEPTYVAQMTVEQLLGIQPIETLVNPGTGEEALEGVGN